jgi:hypothetical protein
MMKKDIVGRFAQAEGISKRKCPMWITLIQKMKITW